MIVLDARQPFLELGVLRLQRRDFLLKFFYPALTAIEAACQRVTRANRIVGCG